MSTRLESTITPYVDGRPHATRRLEAVDHGIVLKHGDAHDLHGARDVWVFENENRLYMHYDAASDEGWLCALAVSDDGMHWTKRGTVLELGAAGSPDSASASYGTTFFDGTDWHMFYLGTPNVQNPGKVPAFPYQTLKARAASPDGVWTKQRDVLPVAAVAGTFYADTASPGMIVKHGLEYLMFFSAAVRLEVGIRRTLGLARTKDLNTAWTVDAQPLLSLEEQIENSCLYFEETSGLWFLFTNHVGIDPRTLEEYTDAIWVYWSHDPTRWNTEDKAVVLDASNCPWSSRIIGLPSVVRVGNRLALFYDGYTGEDLWHMGRDIGLAWLELPLIAPR
jgi:predicted GH43/DUF377 family glycosyl hydrolase